jgi:hypothetical protein
MHDVRVQSEMSKLGVSDVTRIARCSSDPCQVLIGVFRNLSETAHIADVASRLRRLHEKYRRF